MTEPAADGASPRTAPAAPSVHADFSPELLADLYRYPRKRASVAAVLWLALGIVGGHRFYLGRPASALLMFFTAGGGMIWWAIDGFRLAGMVRAINREQADREARGEPPLGLEFLPARTGNVIAEAPEWTQRWRSASRSSRSLRVAGDVTVLVVSGVVLGAVAHATSVYEALLAIAVLAVLSASGSGSARFADLPVARELVRWGHRLRLFYYYCYPGSPLALLVRPITAAMLAPLRRRRRAEVKLYLQFGGVLTVGFLILDLVEAVLADGIGALSPGGLVRLWLSEAAVTFIVIYAFATPIGAVLTLHLLTRRTHVVPRILAGVVLLATLTGLLLAL